jgi:hypothetical protein
MNTKKIFGTAALLAVGTIFGVAIANTKAGSKIKNGIEWGKNKLGLREESESDKEREERSERSESSSASGREDRR